MIRRERFSAPAVFEDCDACNGSDSKKLSTEERSIVVADLKQTTKNGNEPEPAVTT